MSHLTCVYINVFSESKCQFHSFSRSWVYIYSGRQDYKYFIQIEISNYVNKSVKIIFRIGFGISHY